MASVLLLGAAGLLASEMCRVFIRSPHSVKVATRSRSWPGLAGFSSEDVLEVDVSNESGRQRIEREVHRADFVVNSIGITNKHIDNSARSRRDAILLNSWFPHWLDEKCRESSAFLIQIATDCVFEGSEGPHSEGRAKDAQDIYGVSKALGEVDSKQCLNLRSSIVGPEGPKGTGLMHWLLERPIGSRVPGFTNHLWNGVTAASFSNVVLGLVRENTAFPGTFHLVPTGQVSKFELLELIARRAGRRDLRIEPTKALTSIDRRLGTRYDGINQTLWTSAGYDSPPSIHALVESIPTSHFIQEGP